MSNTLTCSEISYVITLYLLLEGIYRFLQSQYPDIQKLQGIAIGLFYRYPLPDIFQEKCEFTGYGTVKILYIPGFEKCFAFSSIALRIAFSNGTTKFKSIKLYPSILPYFSAPGNNLFLLTFAYTRKKRIFLYEPSA